MKEVSITCDSCGEELAIRHDSYPSQHRLKVKWVSIPTTANMIFSIANGPPPSDVVGDFCGLGCYLDKLGEQGRINVD